MDCVHVLEFDDCVQADFYAEAHRKARVRHVCCECQRTIEKRAHYTRVTGSWDGSFAYYKICARCWRLRNKIQDKTNYAIGFGCLREAIQNEKENR